MDKPEKVIADIETKSSESLKQALINPDQSKHENKLVDLQSGTRSNLPRSGVVEGQNVKVDDVKIAKHIRAGLYTNSPQSIAELPADLLKALIELKHEKPLNQSIVVGKEVNIGSLTVTEAVVSDVVIEKDNSSAVLNNSALPEVHHHSHYSANVMLLSVPSNQVCNELKAKVLADVNQQNDHSFPILWNLRPKNIFFTGRNDHLQNIEAVLEEGTYGSYKMQYGSWTALFTITFTVRNTTNSCVMRFRRHRKNIPCKRVCLS